MCNFAVQESLKSISRTASSFQLLKRRISANSAFLIQILKFFYDCVGPLNSTQSICQSMLSEVFVMRNHDFIKNLFSIDVNKSTFDLMSLIISSTSCAVRSMDIYIILDIIISLHVESFDLF